MTPQKKSKSGKTRKTGTAAKKATDKASIDIANIPADSQKLSQLSIEQSSDSIFWIGPNARFLFVNDAACKNPHSVI